MNVEHQPYISICVWLFKNVHRKNNVSSVDLILHNRSASVELKNDNGIKNQKYWLSCFLHGTLQLSRDWMRVIFPRWKEAGRRDTHYIERNTRVERRQLLVSLRTEQFPVRRISPQAVDLCRVYWLNIVAIINAVESSKLLRYSCYNMYVDDDACRVFVRAGLQCSHRFRFIFVSFFFRIDASMARYENWTGLIHKIS